jgi:hypothetical protein
MRTPTQATALAAIGASDDELGQALALLRVAGCAEPEALTLGEGDRLLLALHRAITGEDLEVAVECDACETVSVVMLSPQTVPPHEPRCALLGPGAGLRQPTYGDLMRLPDDPGLAEAELLGRCSVGTPPRPPRSEQLELVDDALTGPVVVLCVECGQPIETAADVQRLVLESLQRCALTLDLELHLLASRYGWSLAEIESLPDDRRRRLANLVADGR